MDYNKNLTMGEITLPNETWLWNLEKQTVTDAYVSGIHKCSSGIDYDEKANRATSIQMWIPNKKKYRDGFFAGDSLRFKKSNYGPADQAMINSMDGGKPIHVFYRFKPKVNRFGEDFGDRLLRLKVPTEMWGTNYDLGMAYIEDFTGEDFIITKNQRLGRFKVGPSVPAAQETEKQDPKKELAERRPLQRGQAPPPLKRRKVST